MTAGCILFRVDAGPIIGLGHLQRCLSLATALRRNDVTCLFLTNDEPTIVDRIARFDFKGYILTACESWGTADLEQTLATAAVEGCSTIIIDSDYEGANYLSQLRSAGYFVVAIEDTTPHSFPCHLVINGDAHARQLSYSSPFKDTRFLLGPEYSILRHEFWDGWHRLLPEDIDNILVILGGADPYNIMPKVIKSLDTLPGTFSITAIVGPFFKNLAEIQAVSKQAQHSIIFVQNPDSVRDLMIQANIAVSAGGQTLYELACVGCPTIAIRIAANQDGQLCVFEEAGFIRIVGHGNNSSIAEAVRDAVGVLFADPEARTAMSAAGQRLVDGKGALRVAQTLLNALDKHKINE